MAVFEGTVYKTDFIKIFLTINIWIKMNLALKMIDLKYFLSQVGSNDLNYYWGVPSVFSV
jgi:hypothetical protein